MSESSNSGTRSIGLRIYVWTLLVLWTVFVSVMLLWSLKQHKHAILEEARHNARSAFEKDLIWRRWISGRGGVYVPVSEETPPNPYLSHIEERDITTRSGRRLTLFNPAYVTRHVHELGDKQYGIRGHITSLTPIRSENAADTWEREVLESFERGVTEVSSVEQINGQNYMRLMRPLLTEESCLKCHAAQGYKVGDIRGGISISIPMKHIWDIARSHTNSLLLGHILIWILGVGGIVLGAQRLRQRIRERKKAEDNLRATNYQLGISEKQLRAASEQLQASGQQLKEANIRLQELDKLKGMFIASMSHELRTPLNSIIGFTGIILQGMSGEITAEQRKQLTMVKSSAAHLLALINDVIDVSKIEAGKVELAIEEFDLAAVVQQVKKSFETTADKQGLMITLEMPKGLIVKSDEGKTKQVIMNLVSNAIKFTDKGRIEIKVSKRDESVEVSVDDTGVGIRKGDINKLFQAFGRIYAENRLTEGSGLGLYLSKKIADLLGGEIKAESEFAKGSKFTFRLPLKYRELEK